VRRPAILTADVLEINDQDKKKSTGVEYSAAQLTVDKEGELQGTYEQNAWKLVDILNWK